MMREIKFRFWNKKINALIPWETMCKECNRLSVFTLPEFKPLQFTGLNDKNGKEIYEGDVLCHVSSIRMGFQTDGKKIYSQIVFGRHNPDNNVLTGYMGFWVTRGEDCLTSISYLTGTLAAEVIGNIYENPELLEL